MLKANYISSEDPLNKETLPQEFVKIVCIGWSLNNFINLTLIIIMPNLQIKGDWKISDTSKTK